MDYGKHITNQDRYELAGGGRYNQRQLLRSEHGTGRVKNDDIGQDAALQQHVRGELGNHEQVRRTTDIGRQLVARSGIQVERFFVG